MVPEGGANSQAMRAERRPSGRRAVVGPLKPTDPEIAGNDRSLGLGAIHIAPKHVAPHGISARHESGAAQ
jgi:hypothetical protein